MKKLLLLLGAALMLGGCTVPSLNKKPAGLEINTSSPATVYLNGASVGTTPYKNTALNAGDYTVKLVPTDSSLSPYETKVTLSSSVSTVISRTLASSDTDTFGYTLALQPDPSGKTLLSVISDPDTVNVTLDGTPHGFTPLSNLDISVGDHSLVVVSPGYVQQNISVNTVKGYNLVVNLKLASQTISLTPPPPATSSASPSPLPSVSPKPSPKVATSSATTVKPPYVVVNTTSTGWLRVRQDASASSSELGKANVGEKLPYLGETSSSGWFKVEFENQTGWVAGQYVTLVK